MKGMLVGCMALIWFSVSCQEMGYLTKEETPKTSVSAKVQVDQIDSSLSPENFMRVRELSQFFREGQGAGAFSSGDAQTLKQLQTQPELFFSSIAQENEGALKGLHTALLGNPKDLVGQLYGLVDDNEAKKFDEQLRELFSSEEVSGSAVEDSSVSLSPRSAVSNAIPQTRGRGEWGGYREWEDVPPWSFDEKDVDDYIQAVGNALYGIYRMSSARTKEEELVLEGIINRNIERMKGAMNLHNNWRPTRAILLSRFDLISTARVPMRETMRQYKKVKWATEKFAIASYRFYRPAWNKMRTYYKNRNMDLRDHGLVRF